MRSSLASLARVSMAAVLALPLACSRSSTADPVAAAPPPKPALDARPAEPEPEPTPEPEPMPEPEPEPTLSWRDDPRVRAQLHDVARSDRRGHEDAMQPPKDPVVEALVDDAGVEVIAIHGQWSGEQTDDWLTRVARTDLLVHAAGRTHVVPLARQYQELFREHLAERLAHPRVGDVQWRGAGVPGPDLVLSVAYESVWGTQCDDGFDERTDVVICELEAGALQCARGPVELRYYDGCGGQESIEHELGDPEEECTRIAYSATWRAEADRLQARLKRREDVHCLDPEASGDRGEPRGPVPRSIPYERLLSGPHRIEVVTVLHDTAITPAAR